MAGEEARLAEGVGGLDMAAGPTGQLEEEGFWHDMAADGTEDTGR